MPFSSPCPVIDIPKKNILSYCFPPGEELPDTPLWIDSENNSLSLSLKQMSIWVNRIAIGLDNLGVKPGTVVMIYTPNHIFVPAAYLGIVGSGRIFSGTNPAYTVHGQSASFLTTYNPKSQSANLTQRSSIKSRTPKPSSFLPTKTSSPAPSPPPSKPAFQLAPSSNSQISPTPTATEYQIGFP
jgi:acyl-CoA synthetase (AMP-forming)/AMP-acid ligase II